MIAVRALLAEVLVAGCLCLPALAAETLEVGGRIEPFSIEDQFGESHAVDASLRAILFTREMKAGEIVKRALADEGSAQLSTAGALYVSDVSGMPALVRRLFAIPGMRKRGYAMGLDIDGSLTRDFPSAEGRATLLVLDRLQVKRIEELDSPEALSAALARLRDPESTPAPEPEVPAEPAP